MAYFKVSSKYFHGGSQNVSQDCQPLGQELNPGPADMMQEQKIRELRKMCIFEEFR
jgi:hypothetical protein